MRRYRSAIRWVLFLLVPLNAGAINMQRQYPSTGYRFMFTESSQRPDLDEFGPLLAEVQYGFSSSPLTWFDASGANRRDYVGSLHSLHLNVGTLLGPSLFVGANAVLHSFDTMGGSRRFAAGDSRVSFKYLFPAVGSFDAAVQAYALVPTGTRKDFLSDGGFGYGAKGILQRRFGPWLVATNLGYEHSGSARWLTLDYREEVVIGAGARLGLTNRAGLNAEARLTYTAAHRFSRGPADLYFGPDLKIQGGSVFSIGASVGGIAIDNTTNFRVLASLKVFPFAKDESDPTIVRIPGCVNKDFSRKYVARRLTPREIETLRPLPYFSTVARAMPVLQAGEFTDRAEGGLAYVNNGMSVFAVDVEGLPPRRTVIDAIDARIQMKIRQLGKVDGRAHPELFCFLREKVCSGYVRLKSSWRNNVDRGFFGHKDTPNDYFSRWEARSPVANVGERRVFSETLTLDMRKLLENVEGYDASRIVYGEKGATGKNAIYFLVAGDTYVDPEGIDLALKFRYNDCSSMSESEGER